MHQIQGPVAQDPDTFNVRGALLNVYRTAVLEWRMILVTCAAVLAVVIAYTIWWPPIYEAQATLMSEGDRDTSRDSFYSGWTVFRKHWRQGIATEAARAASAYAFERHGVDHVIAHIDPKNLPSVRVSERLGMRYEGEVDFYTEKTGRYVLAR